MSGTLDPLIRDLVAWLAPAPRPYAEVMDAWRTSCPRLTVWEDALDQGVVRRVRDRTGANFVEATPRGLALLQIRPGPDCVSAVNL